jgi:hypothetical protein
MHLNGIELDCRQWLRVNAGNVLRVEALDGIEQTLAKGRAFKYEGINQDEIENGETHIVQKDFEEEAKNILAEQKSQLGKEASEGGGLGLPRVQTPNSFSSRGPDLVFATDCLTNF